MDIVVLDGYTENPGDLSWSGFDVFGKTTVYDRTPKDQAVKRIGNAEIVVTNKTVITGEIMDSCPAIRYIGILAAGYEVVDIAAARERGIVVTNIPAYGTNAVAQFAFALLLELTSMVGHHAAAVKQGRWANNIEWCFWDAPLMELSGKTMGIIGFGRIGQATGRIARAMGMRVLANDLEPNDAGRAIAEYTDLDRLLAESDVIALHCNLTPVTRELIRKETICKMKDGVIIINNARGPMVNERDLADALNSGKVAGAAVDVVSKEPIAEDNPLLSAKNCLITPHISWAPIECRRRIMDIAVGNLKAFLEGRSVNIAGN